MISDFWYNATPQSNVLVVHSIKPLMEMTLSNRGHRKSETVSCAPPSISDVPDVEYLGPQTDLLTRPDRYGRNFLPPHAADPHCAWLY